MTSSTGQEMITVANYLAIWEHIKGWSKLQSQKRQIGI